MMSSSARVLLPRLLLLALPLALASCTRDPVTGKRRFASRRKHTAVWSPATLTAVRGVPVADVQNAIASRLGGDAPPGVESDAWKHARVIYRSYGGVPLWLTGEGIATGRARALLESLARLPGDALVLDSYPTAALSAALTTLHATRTPTAQQIAEADILLTTAYAAVGEHLMAGDTDPAKHGQAWHISTTHDNIDSALVASFTDTLDRAIDAMRPQDLDYQGLQKELARYREIVARGGWPRVPAGRTLRAGQSDSPARLAALRARLAAEGYDVPAATPAVADTSGVTLAPGGERPRRARRTPAPSTATGPGVYDTRLAEMVGTFQARHAVTVDRALNPETVEALNVPAEYRLGQIAANLERLRWMPRVLGDDYIFVNVPAFHLEGYRDGEKAIEMKTIVGQEYADRATPVFADSMETVVFRPYWLITPDIQAKEIEPKLASNPGYLERENMEYYSDGGQRRIRQRPGGKNALGLVKFLFPNDFNIYLHDTPNHELFRKDVRAFSHGCIRLEKPAELAQWVLGWDAERVQQAMEAGPDNRSVRLPRKLPVYIVYSTAFVRDGQLYFGNDLYHRDDRLVQAVMPGALPDPRAVQALQALRSLV